MSAPLQGIRVVELASFVAAPSAGALLHDLGADVVKVEVPWGEVYRHSKARMMGVDSDFDLGAPFQMSNHGKRSLALDLALPQAQAALKQVVDGADVLLTNMLPGRVARYGLDAETLLQERPELIVARLSIYNLDRAMRVYAKDGWTPMHCAAAHGMCNVIDVLAREVGVIGIFSDWPATTTFYANCMGLAGRGH